MASNSPKVPGEEAFPPLERAVPEAQPIGPVALPESALEAALAVPLALPLDPVDDSPSIPLAEPVDVPTECADLHDSRSVAPTGAAAPPVSNDVAAQPRSPVSCPVCNSSQATAQGYCSNCGFVFRSESPPAALAASLVGGRYELGQLLDQRGDLFRFQSIEKSICNAVYIDSAFKVCHRS